MFTSHRFLTRALAAIAVAAVCQGAHATTSYTATALSLLPGGHFLDAYAINDNGTITGYGYSQGTNMGFVWQNGQLSSLGTLPGYDYSGGYDINNQGVIAGGSGGQAFTWQSGQIKALPTLAGATYASANAINDAGVVVGSSGGNAVVWANGSASTLALASNLTGATATDINDQGTAVGNGFDSWYNSTPLLWVNGQVNALSTGTRQHGGATGLNNANAVSGYVTQDNANEQAARWDNGQLTLLDQLDGVTQARAYAINDAGQVVGSSFSGPGSIATLWEGTHAIALQSLLVNGEAWQLWQAQDINASGQIVGWGTFNGQAQSFLLTPVPEGATWSYLVMGLIGMSAAMARRQRLSHKAPAH
jgi:probable HAF family extracellular repeat protein